MIRSELAGGAAVVSGAARGLGKGLARAAAGHGMSLVLVDRDAEALGETERELTQSGTKVLAVVMDVTDTDAVQRLGEATYERFGGVRLLVNNVGVEAIGYSWEFSALQWEDVVRTNFLSAAQMVRAFVGRMVAAAEPALILNVASVASLTMVSSNAPYIASKHALMSLSECLFLEMQSQAPMIHVGVALPGPIATDSFRRAVVGSNPETFAHYQTFMDRTLSVYGMAPDEAGAMILDQLMAGQFWITTSPDMLADYAERRARYIAKREDPTPHEHAHIVLGD